MLKKFSILIAGAFFLAILFLLKDPLGSRGDKDSEKEKNRVGETSNTNDKGGNINGNNIHESDSKSDTPSVPEQKPSEKKKGSDEVITQILTIRGRVEKSLIPKSSTDSELGRSKFVGLDNTTEPAVIREGLLINFTVVGETNAQFFNLGSIYTDQDGEFSAEYSYKKPTSRKDTLVISWVINGVLTDSGIKSWSDMPAGSSTNISISGNRTKSFQITSNPMFVNADLTQLAMGHLVLNLSVPKSGNGLENIWMTIGGFVEGQSINELLPQNTYVTFSAGQVKPGPLKLHLQAGVEFRLIGTLGPQYKNWVAKILLKEDETKYIDVNIEKANPSFIGQCIDETGRPVANVSISVNQNGSWVSARVGEDGTFKIDLDESSKVDYFQAYGNGLWAYSQNVPASDLKKIILTKSKTYKISLDCPEEYKKLIGTIKSKVLCITDKIPDGLPLYPVQSENVVTIHSQFAPGSKKLVFKQFDDIYLEWKTYHEETVEINESTPAEFTIKIPAK